MRINSIQSCARKLHQESQCTGQPADWRKGALGMERVNDRFLLVNSLELALRYMAFTV